MARSAPLICGGHSRPIPDIRYSTCTEDGIFLISACLDGKPMLRNGESGDWVGTFEGHKGAVWSAAMDPPALRSITGSADFTVKLWNAISGDELHSFQHSHIVKTVDFSQDSNRILSGGHEKNIRIFDISKYDAEPFKLDGLPNVVKVAVFAGKAHDDNLVLAGFQGESNIMIFDLRTKGVAKTLTTSGPVSSMEISLDGKHIATACGREAQFWDVNTFELQRAFPFPSTSSVESASLHPDNKKFVAGCSDNWVRVMDFATGKELECLKGHHGPVHAVRICPNGESFASGSEDGTIRIWAYLGLKAEGMNGKANGEVTKQEPVPDSKPI
eukprot:CAMPEP_0184645174 /NCGR_PEP_ID=MMETSP0308-20130426/1700_1 /TAXON_ID=38269 /ORGANISM="Gloeochaete witrockiana, Strain SAG 46.84" /LENGTH=328 /DNA_ID=CAMNT_0027074025 /DNA_START=150 /DNA_END=1136 /DNA_ORIENTATION=-